MDPSTTFPALEPTSITNEQENNDDDDDDVHETYDFFDMNQTGAESNYNSNDRNYWESSSHDRMMMTHDDHHHDVPTDDLKEGVHNKVNDTPLAPTGVTEDLLMESSWQPSPFQHESKTIIQEVDSKVESIMGRMREYTQSIVVQDLTHFLIETDSIMEQYYACRGSQFKEANRLTEMGPQVQTACDQMLGNYRNRNNNSTSCSSLQLR